MSFFCHHERDITRNTNVMQLRDQITFVNTLAERLRGTRIALGLSQKDLAKRAGCGQSAIGNIETGARLQPRNLLALAAALGVSPQWLETGKGHREEVVGDTAAPSAVPHKLADPQHTTEQALQIVLDALADLSPVRWGMVMAGLQPLAGHPEMRDDVLSDILPLLVAGETVRKQA